VILKRRLVSGVALLAALGVFAPIFAWAQETHGPTSSKPAETIQKAPEGSIRVKVQVVNTPVAVRDAKNNVILDLRKENFQILDNKEKQTIESFDLAGEPLSASARATQERRYCRVSDFSVPPLGSRKLSRSSSLPLKWGPSST